MQMPNSRTLEWLLLKWGIPASVGLGLMAHGILMGYHECENTQILKLKNNKIGIFSIEQKKCISIISNIINILSRLAYDVTLLTSFFEIQRRLKQNGVSFNCSFNETLILIILISISVSFTNYYYYNQKIGIRIKDYYDRFERERTNEVFGRIMCLFHSVQEYSDYESSPLLHDARVSTRPELLFSNDR